MHTSHGIISMIGRAVSPQENLFGKFEKDKSIYESSLTKVSACAIRCNSINLIDAIIGMNDPPVH